MAAAAAAAVAAVALVATVDDEDCVQRHQSPGLISTYLMGENKLTSHHTAPSCTLILLDVFLTPGDSSDIQGIVLADRCGIRTNSTLPTCEEMWSGET